MMHNSILLRIKADLSTIARIDSPDDDPMVISTVQTMTPMQQSRDSPYLRAYKGRLKGVLRWDDLDEVWAQLRRLSDDGWYVYAVGESPPTAPASRDQFERFLVDIRQLLQDEHKEDYCGIVYADDHEQPAFVKIFDPNHLGKVCGSSEAPPLPGWTLSRVVPDNLEHAFTQTGDRRRWWQAIFR